MKETYTMTYVYPDGTTSTGTFPSTVTIWTTCLVCKGLGFVNTYQNFGENGAGISISTCLACNGRGSVQLHPGAIPTPDPVANLLDTDTRLRNLENAVQAQRQLISDLIDRLYKLERNK